MVNYYMITSTNSKPKVVSKDTNTSNMSSSNLSYSSKSRTKDRQPVLSPSVRKNSVSSNTNTSFGNTLRIARLAYPGLTYTQLAGRLMLNRTTVARYEAGKIKPSEDTLFGLVKVLNAPQLVESYNRTYGTNFSLPTTSTINVTNTTSGRFSNKEKTVTNKSSVSNNTNMSNNMSTNSKPSYTYAQFQALVQQFENYVNQGNRILAELKKVIW